MKKTKKQPNGYVLVIYLAESTEMRRMRKNEEENDDEYYLNIYIHIYSIINCLIKWLKRVEESQS